MATNVAHPNVRPPRPLPTGPAPPAPTTAPPAPPTNVQTAPTSRQSPAPNGISPRVQPGRRRAEPQVDPAQMYEMLKNRVAVLEEDAVQEEEEERRITEEAHSNVSGLEEKAVHAKYVELFAEFKRQERDHAKEKQKLVKDKDAAKGQLTKSNQTRTKMENLARELQKDNKRLREDSKRLAQCVEEAQEEITQMKNDMAKRAERAKAHDRKYREMPDIVVKVICKYRAELFFKISRKTKLSRLFNAWTERMEHSSTGKKVEGKGMMPATTAAPINGTMKADVDESSGSMQFVFTHAGHSLEADQTPEEAGMEDGDEILAVEIMDLTEGPETDIIDAETPLRAKLKKTWTEDPHEAGKVVEEIFDGIMRERLKIALRQYELRERHFECVIRSKELEVLLSRARAAEQKQLSEGEKVRADKAEEENQALRTQLLDVQSGQTMLIDKLIACCKEPNAERTQRLFASLREELEKRGTKLADGPMGG